MIYLYLTGFGVFESGDENPTELLINKVNNNKNKLFNTKYTCIKYAEFYEVNSKEKEIAKEDNIRKINRLINDTITDVERTNNQYIAKGNSLSDSKINEYLNLQNNVNNQNARGESI